MEGRMDPKEDLNMTRIRRPGRLHLAGRYLGTRFRGVKGLDRLLRIIHSPDERRNSWIETVASAAQGGPSFYLSTRWFPEWTTWFYGSQDKDIYGWINRNARPEWVAFDVGMNFGFFACVLAQECAQSHGFEPVQWLADRAEANSKLNQFTNLLINRVALSNKIAETELFLPSPDDANWGQSSIVRSTGVGPPLQIPTDTMDHYVSQRNLRRLDFIKIDVEGAEDLVLEGAVESLTKFYPAIIFEVNTESISRCVQLLGSLGYRLSDLNGSRLPKAMDEWPGDVLALH
jgi:FkbM family methyltransferase